MRITLSTTTVLSPSLPCSFTSSPLSLVSEFKFNFPAKFRWISPSTARSRLATLRASPLPYTEDESGEIRLNRRRIVVLTVVAPLHFQFHGSQATLGAEAVESDSSYSLLVKSELQKVVTKARAAGLLRLAFHDAGTFEMDDDSGGMNGSIIYELERPENAGLKKSLKVIEKAKIEVDVKLSASWADMIAVAGAEAVSVCEGPAIPIRLGRIDSMEPDTEGRLPQESLDAAGLKQCFQRKGLSTQELVALSGAHTLGSKGFGNPTVFDNSYYKILLDKPWNTPGEMSSMIGLPSDRALIEDKDCLRWIEKYADDQNIFFEDFKNAYIKLVNLGAKWKKF